MLCIRCELKMNEIAMLNSTSSMLIVILSGITMLNMLCLVVAFIVYKTRFLRVSGASAIAAMVFAWFSWLAMAAALPVDYINAGWVGGVLLLALITVYVFWLKVFQPHSVQYLLKKELYLTTTNKIDVEMRKLRQQYKTLDKNSEKYRQVQGQIKSLKENRISAKREFNA